MNCPKLDALLRLTVAFLITKAALFAFQDTPKVESTLQIAGYGVERSEDAPFAPADFRFLPGDFVYFQFQISGYAVKTAENNEVRKMSLNYEVSPQDSKGIALAPPVTGAIKEDLGNEDKNWAPKRRHSFLLPSFVSAGDFHLHVSVKDLIGNTATERDIPFKIGGMAVAPSANLGVQDFQFLRSEDDATGLDVPSYRPGDTVYARFNMVGFHLGSGNQYHLSYGLTVTRPDGKPYLDVPSAAELSEGSFYPVPYVPGNINITTAHNTTHGQYVITLTIRDVNDKQSYQLKRAFSIE